MIHTAYLHDMENTEYTFVDQDIERSIKHGMCSNCTINRKIFEL